jgi:anti-sigma B factor antagonist
MTIAQRDIGDVVVLDLQGKIMGGADSDAFQRALRALVDAGHRKVLVNLEQVSWINSSGLGILIEGFSALQRQGGTLKLVHVPPRIESVLAVTKLSTIFESYRQEDEAVQSFA